MKLLLYLLQVAACTGVFYLLYYLALRRLTFFELNRWYLLASLLLSFVIPLVTIPAESVVQLKEAAPEGMVTEAADLRDSFTVPDAFPDPQKTSAPATIPSAPENNSLNFELLLPGLYLLITCILGLRMLVSLFLLILRLRAAQAEKAGSLRIIRNSRHFRTGSFFHYIFITGPELSPQELQQVLAHEEVHARQLHSLDKLVAGVVKVILWFNPFAYAYAHAIDASHEFEVDYRVTEKTDKSSYAELLLRLTATAPRQYHQFSKLPLQVRIKMLYHKPSENMKKLT